MLCGAQGSWGAVGAAGVGAPTLVGWRAGVCVWGWAWGDVPEASAFSLRLLEGLPQAPEDIRVVLGRGEVAGVDPQGLERIGQHGFPCGLWHPPSRRLEATVLCRPLTGPVDHTLEGGLCPGPIFQLRELRVGPALPPLSLGRAADLGGGVSVGGCDGVEGTGGGGEPGGSVPWECVESGGAGGWGLAGTRARSLPQGWVETRSGGGSGAFALCGLTSRVGRGAGTLPVTLALFSSSQGGVRGPGLRALRGVGTKRVAFQPRCAPP